MLNVSDKFKKAMKQPVKELLAYISNGTININQANDLISFKITCDSGMCKTAMRKLEAKYLGETNFLGQWVYVGFAVKVEDGTFEYLDYGSFLVTEITYNKDTGTTNIIGYDKMVNTMTEYSKLDIEYPINLLDYTDLLCKKCGLTLGNESFVNADWVINGELWENINGITYRDIFVQIAQVTGTTCIIRNDDKLYFKPITPTNEQLTYDNIFKLKLEPKYGEINSIVLSRTPAEDNIYMKDEESILINGLTEFKIENNEIIDKDREGAMTPIYEALHGISYFPFETTTEGLGWYEIGDSFDIINDLGDVFNTSLFNFSITLDGGIKEILKTTAETKTQTQYQYATTIAKRVKNTEIIVNKQEQFIQQLVADMYTEDGILNENFTKIYQDIYNIVNSVQNSGGNNLIKNSVMFAYDNNGNPKDWDISNRNLFDINTSISGYLNEDNGITDQDSTSKERTSDFINVTGIEKLILNLRVTVPSGGYIWWGYLYYDENKNPIGERISLHDQPSTLTINVPTEAKYVRVSTRFYDNGILRVEPVGSLIIDSNTESLNVGALSGHSFTLLDKIITQIVTVKQDNEDISEENKTYYTFSAKIKKALTGTCYIKLYNDYESHIIQLDAGESAFYKEYELKLLPKDTYYKIEFYGSADSDATFTDNMLSIGSFKSPWTQANGEIMNTQVNVNVDGVLVKSSIYQGDYTIMSPLEFAGYSNVNGTITRVFTLNKDTTLVKKLEAEDEVKMVPIKIVPVTSGDLQGWAFVPSE